MKNYFLGWFVFLFLLNINLHAELVSKCLSINPITGVCEESVMVESNTTECSNYNPLNGECEDAGNTDINGTTQCENYNPLTGDCEDNSTQEVPTTDFTETINEDNTTTVKITFKADDGEEKVVEVVVDESVDKTTNPDGSVFYEGTSTQNTGGSFVKPESNVSVDGTVLNKQTLTINGVDVEAFVYIDVVGAKIEISDDGSIVSSVEIKGEDNTTIKPEVQQTKDGKTISEFLLVNGDEQRVVNVVSDVVGTDSNISSDGTLTTTAQLSIGNVILKPKSVVNPDGSSTSKLVIVDENNQSIEIEIRSNVADSNISIDENGSIELVTSVTTGTDTKVQTKAKISADGTLQSESTFTTSSGEHKVVNVSADIPSTNTEIKEDGSSHTTTPTLTSDSNKKASASVEVTSEGLVIPTLNVTSADGSTKTFKMVELPAGSGNAPLVVKTKKEDDGSISIEIDISIPSSNIKKEE